MSLENGGVVTLVKDGGSIAFSIGNPYIINIGASALSVFSISAPAASSMSAVACAIGCLTRIFLAGSLNKYPNHFFTTLATCDVDLSIRRTVAASSS